MRVRLPSAYLKTFVAGAALMLAACAAPAGGRPAKVAPSPAALSRAGAQIRPPGGADGGQAASSTPATPLLVNDADATDPSVVPATVSVPPGFSFPSHSVSLLPGFSISLLAQGLQSPRFMAFDPSGNLIVGSDDDAVYRLPSANGAVQPAAQLPAPLLTGLRAPHSVGFDGGYLYVAETNRVSRYAYGADGILGAAETVIGDLPLQGEHFTRTIVFGPDGKLWYTELLSNKIGHLV